MIQKKQPYTGLKVYSVFVGILHDDVHIIMITNLISNRTRTHTTKMCPVLWLIEFGLI